MSKMDELQEKIRNAANRIRHGQEQDDEYQGPYDDDTEYDSPADDQNGDYYDGAEEDSDTYATPSARASRTGGFKLGSAMEPRQKLKAIYIAGVAMIALVCLISLIYASVFSRSARYTRELERGQQYLDNNQYQQAVDSYSVVIKIDEKCTEAYLKRAQAYVGMNDYASAESDYEKVVELEVSNYDAYMALAQVMVAQTKTNDAIRVLERGYTETRYGPIYDLLYRYKSESRNTTVSGNVSLVTGGVISGAAGAKVTVIDRMLDREMSVAYTGADGEYDIAAIAGSYTLTVAAEGYMDFSYNFDLSEGQHLQIERIPLISSTAAEATGSIQVALTDASTGTAKSSAAVNLRRGWDNSSGDYVMELSVYTNESGSAVVGNIPAGYYTLEYSCDGYITAVNNVAITSGTVYVNNCMSPVVEDNCARVVLTWGSGVKDLDIHVAGMGDYADEIDINYAATGYSVDGALRVQFECKNSSGFGPESVLIRNGIVGDGYVVYVYDYDNRANETSDKMSNCEALISLYVGNELKGQVRIPAGNVGLYWYACSISPDWTITPINTFASSLESTTSDDNSAVPNAG